MTSPLHPTIRLLGCCGRAATILAVSSAHLCFAQQSVATLGIPKASTFSNSQSAPSSEPLPNESVSGAGHFVFPPIRVNKYVPAQIETARGNVEEILRADVTDASSVLWQSFQSSANAQNDLPVTAKEPAKTQDALVGTPGMFLSAFSESKPAELARNPATAEKQNQKWTPALPRMSVTPAEPQLSPIKWVHQPLVADPVRQPESKHTIGPESRDRNDRKNDAKADDQVADAVQADLQPITDISSAVEPSSANSDPTRSAAYVRPLTEIRRAAMRQRASRTEETYIVPGQSEPIQPGYSIEALRKSAMELIAEAQLKLDTHAYLTAEDKAIAALELIAQSIDTREQSALATRDLMVSLTAIREAEDFVGKYGMVDGKMITRMVRSHSTEILKPYNTSKLNGLAAADVYLDWSRRCITPLATADPLGSEAIRILAHSHRLRDDGSPFGVATAVHLMRAAADGAPDNYQVHADYQATLQIAGLPGGSQIARVQNTTSGLQTGQMVSHMPGNAIPAKIASVMPAGRFQGEENRDVEILEVSPEQFAAISPAMAGPPGTASPQSMPMAPQYSVQHNTQNNQQRGPYRPEHVNEASPNEASPNHVTPYQASPYRTAPYQAGPMQSPDNSVKGRLSRAFNPITRLLR